MKHPFFSILVPVYNTETYLEECLQSIAGQNFKNFEVLIVNDGSRDTQTYFQIKNTFQKDKRFRFFEQPNQGVSVARNTGLEQARGEIILFLDSDDKYYTPTQLNDLTLKLRDFKANAVYCLDSIYHSRDGYTGFAQRPRRPSLETELVFFIIPTYALIVPAKLAKKARFKPGFWHGEESLYFFELYFSTLPRPRLISLHVPNVYYRYRATGNSKKASKNLESKNFKKIYRHLLKRPLNARQKTLCYLGLIRYSLYPTSAGVLAKALTLLAKLLARWW